MKKVLYPCIEAGSKKSHEPRLLGSIVEEMLHGSSPLAVGYRQYIASQENGEGEEHGWHANTELCIDLKTKLLHDRLLKPEKSYLGILRLNSKEPDLFGNDDRHCTFVEAHCSTAARRNPHVYNGRHITCTRRDDGSLRLNFKPMNTSKGFNLEHYAFGVYREIHQALEGLIEK